jgi:hypothetical protein
VDNDVTVRTVPYGVSYEQDKKKSNRMKEKTHSEAIYLPYGLGEKINKYFMYRR